MPPPTEIRLDRAARVLHVSFEDGTRYALPAEYLRVESPSAEVQGHHPGQKQTVAGRRHVGIIAVEPVGHYAVRLVFDDLHDTGIFSWDYLAELGGEQDRRWAGYLDALAARGLSRDPG
ncbi:gamma-butyrobetaine hydroxylase-like domain-containing protein [Rhodopila sp.]|uniref:gamma-butyrobetaine hydroxylase-like domain-containing protein n=1 Tax=Rhodopila sp. TaxID=2480087 RepID=UPI003D1027B8